jgi:hypothetical protein
LERDRAVDNDCLGMGDPCPIVYPDRHARRGQRIDATRTSARRRLVGDHPNVNAALFGPDQRPDDAGTDREAIGGDEDLSLRVVNGADRECRAILSGRKTDRDRRGGGDGGRGLRGRDSTECERYSELKDALRDTLFDGLRQIIRNPD